MTYQMKGLSPGPFRRLFALSDEELAEHRARRVVADSARGFPCRVTLEDAAEGEEVLLVNHVSHDVEGPYRTAYAIYVRKGAEVAACYEDAVPPYLDSRPLGLRGFDAAGMLKGALLAMPGEADARIRELLGRPEIETIHAHNAAHGCFMARIERS